MDLLLKQVVASNNLEIKLTDLIEKDACKKSLCWVINNSEDIIESQSVGYHKLICLLETNGRDSDASWVKDNFANINNIGCVAFDPDKHKILFGVYSNNNNLYFLKEGKCVKVISTDETVESNLNHDIGDGKDIGLMHIFDVTSTYLVETQEQLVQIMKEYF